MDVITVLFVFPLVTVLIGAIFLWFSTQTDEDAWQKLFIGLGVLLLATTFLQTAGIHLGDYSEECNVTRNYANFTVPSKQILKLNHTSENGTIGEKNYTYTTETQPAHETPLLLNKTTECKTKGVPDFSQGHIAWFLVIAFVFILLLAWFFIQMIGLTVSNIRKMFLR